MKKRGISLIVLIVTIVVIIILASVVILTISKNNPIESAKEASFKEDIRTFQDELAMYILKDYTSKGGARDNKITATNYNPAGDPESVYTYIPSFSKKYEGKFVIKSDELMYNEETVGVNEKEWCKSLNVKANAKTGAEKAKEDPAKYYGAKVTNYTANGISDWKIFYSDGSNIFIISSDYIDVNKLPFKNNKKPENIQIEYPKAATFYHIYLENTVLDEYTGTENITDEKIKALNSDYFKNNYSSTYNNMKAVAYMLDKDIWENFVDSSVAEYAVGGPSIEMLLASYSKKHNEDYRAQAANKCGYQISKDGGETWANFYGSILDKTDSLYVLPASSGANAMWLSSPSNKNIDSIIDVGFSGYVGNDGSLGGICIGFRPLVCLNSNIFLTRNEVTGDCEISQ